MPIDSLVEGGRPNVGIAPGWRLLCIGSASLIVLLLFALGAQPVAVGLFPEPWDKLAHLIVFAIIASLLWIGFGGQRPLLVIALVAAIGALDEWHQFYLPGRSADFSDFLTDTVAAIMAVLLLQRGRK